MAQNVKKLGQTGPGSRISSKHQITIPRSEFGRAGLQEGAIMRVRAVGPGQLLVTRIDDVLATYSGIVNTGGEARRALDALRDDWD